MWHRCYWETETDKTIPWWLGVPVTAVEHLPHWLHRMTANESSPWKKAKRQEYIEFFFGGEAGRGGVHYNLGSHQRWNDHFGVPEEFLTKSSMYVAQLTYRLILLNISRTLEKNPYENVLSHIMLLANAWERRQLVRTDLFQSIVPSILILYILSYTNGLVRFFSFFF